jgi:cold shock CspA family protein
MIRLPMPTVVEEITIWLSAQWFNPTKGYWVHHARCSGPDVFVHISAVEKAKVGYELMTGRSGKTSAAQRT